MVYLVVYLATFVGFVILIVPGIIVGIMFSQTMYLVVDRNATVSDALQLSRKLTAGRKLDLFGLFAIVWLLSIVAAIPCYLGLIIFLPWAGILMAVVYLRLSGQAIAADADVVAEFARSGD